MARLRTALVLLVVLLGGTAPAVAQQRSEKAKAAFYDGRKAYEAGDYARAYDLFKQSYILSQEPALLYNIASTLQAMERPGDAARALRDYLEAVPSDPEKSALERRIAALDKAQALMERDRRESAPKVAPTPTPTPTPTPPTDGKLSPEAQQQLDAQAARGAETRRQLDVLRSELKSQRSLDGDLIGRLNRQLESDRKKRRNLAIGLSIGGVVIVGAAVGLAIFLTREPKDTSTPADLGPFTSTE